jgi:hypothetical protein
MLEIIRLGFYLIGWWVLVASCFFAERLVVVVWQWCSKRKPRCPPDLLLRMGYVCQFMGEMYTASLFLRFIFHYPRTVSEPSVIRDHFAMAVCLTILVDVVMDNERIERLLLWLRWKLVRSHATSADRLAMTVKLALITAIAIAQFTYWVWMG